MKIVVIVKEVPDTEARITLSGGAPDLAQLNMVVNPYDEYAVEEALCKAEAEPGSEVTAVLIGREGSRKSLVNVLALGVNQGVIVVDDALTGADPLQLAQVLKAAIAPLEPDLILAGKQGVDTDWGLTAIALAEELGWPHVGLCGKIELSAGRFRAESEGDDGRQTIEGALPAVFTAEKGINEPRYASLKGIMAAKKKPIEQKSLADLGLDPAVVGGAAAKARFVGYEYPPQKPAGRIIDGETVEEKVGKLIDALRNEAKVI